MNHHSIKFLVSALTESSAYQSTEEIVQWMYRKKESIHVNVQQIPLNELKQWHFDDETHNLKHNSGKFFSIDGIRISTNFGTKQQWEQPIINQPEIGFLGILTQVKNGILHFLLQAKIEPGNINVVQLSPTLQATKSNYTQVHKGAKPTFLEYFNGERKVDVLIDQLQSEQGARFLRKRNRNIIIEIPENENLEVPDNFIWLTLKQIKELMIKNNLVNMDTRTVISSINYGEFQNITDFYDIISQQQIQPAPNFNPQFIEALLCNNRYLYSIELIISWITSLKSKYEIDIQKINLNAVSNWISDGITITHVQKKYFSVIGTRVQIGNREVHSWDQPMVKPAQEGLIGFIVKKINNTYHFLVQAKVEIGCLDILEIAPTVQCLTGNYQNNVNEYIVPFIDIFLNPGAYTVLHQSLQSEEGGRFYQEQNLNMIIEVDDTFSNDVPENYFWMTYPQLLLFMKFNNYLNIATRNLISLISIS
ncbi:MAG TPA: NDP-hexose 2,3-dehydratase family protein [Bacteroidales bacterium]|nr:NDP-hexose 2,3-dehydratase family protein [Bacteroidales bacterium]HPS72178.1 NDP-hexose 2,3-dehydratase family protein [Bacteroidales bacterium]